MRILVLLPVLKINKGTAKTLDLLELIILTKIDFQNQEPSPLLTHGVIYKIFR